MSEREWVCAARQMYRLIDDLCTGIIASTIVRPGKPDRTTVAVSTQNWARIRWLAVAVRAKDLGL